MCNLFWGLVLKGRDSKPCNGCIYETVLPDVLYVTIWIYIVTWPCLKDFIFMHTLLPKEQVWKEKEKLLEKFCKS